MGEQIERQAGNSTFPRRTMMQGAAWAVPVVMVGVAAPAHAASLPDGVDVRVSAFCDGQYDISTLEALLAGVPLVGSLTDVILSDLVKAALAVLGFNEGATRRFEISADSGEIPVGTVFQLESQPGSLIEITALQNLLAAQALFVATVNPQGFILTTTAPISTPPRVVELQSLLLDADVLTATSLTLLDTDIDTPDEAPDSATINTAAGAYVDLGALNLGAVLETVLPGAANLLLRGVIRALLGDEGGLAVLDGLQLRVQRCAV